MGGLQQHGRDLPVAPAGRPAASAVLRSALVLVLVAWVIRSLILTGAVVLNEPIGQTLRTSPASVQAMTGSGFAQSLIALQPLIPTRARIYLLWDGPNDEGLRDYAYFWGSYWLYPRRVTVSSSLDGFQPTHYDRLIRAVQGTPAPRPELAGLTPDHVLTYPGGWTITVYSVGTTSG